MLNMKKKRKNGFCQPAAMEWKLLSIVLKRMTERKMAFPLYVAAPDPALTVLLLSVCS